MRERSGGRGLRTLLASAFLLLSLGCKQCPPPPPPPKSPFRPDWTETRHAHATLSTHDDDALLRVEVGPGARERPPRQLLLCNVDDDDGLNGRDCENDEIDGQADAEDLARVEIGPIRNCIDQHVEIRIADASAVRLFDGNGNTRLGPEVGATWTLAPDMLQKLETDRMRVFAEGCAFGARTELDVVVEDQVVARAVLEVAPLLFHPPGTPAEEIWISRDDDEFPGDASYYGQFAAAHADMQQSASDDCRPPLRDLVVGGEGNPLQWDIWLQDAMQWAYTQTPFAYLPVVIRMPRGDPLRLWAEGHLGEDVGTIRPSPSPDCGVQRISLAFGGNLEACAAAVLGTEGCIVHGFRAGQHPLSDLSQDKLARLREFLDEAARQDVHEIDTSWLAVGHVDEILSVVPDPELDGGVVVLVASPGRAVAALEDLPDEQRIVPDRIAVRYKDLARDPTGPVQPDGTKALVWADFLEATVPGGSTTLTAYNLALERLIFGDVLDPSQPGVLGPLIERLEDAGVDPVEVPVLFHHPKDMPVGLTAATALLPNSVNLVPVGRRLFAPAPLVPKLREALDDRFEDVEWIDTFHVLHTNRGGLHCVTNTKPAQPARPWWKEE